MPYFYKIFLTELDASKLMFNFTSFFYENKMLYLTEVLPQAINFKKGMMTYTEQELLNMTDLKLVSEAIILSMILLPAEIELKDLYISPISLTSG